MSERPSKKLFMCGGALLALAAVIVTIPLPGSLALALAVAAAGIVSLAAGWKRRRDERYDLSLLWEAPPPEPEEPHRDHIPHDEESAPYCGWCDEAYAPGVSVCRHCGRSLG